MAEHAHLRPAQQPGVARPRRLRPSLVWELVGCAMNGHELVGTDVARLRDADAALVREYDGLRWYRCLRCDSWLPILFGLRGGGRAYRIERDRDTGWAALDHSSPPAPPPGPTTPASVRADAPAYVQPRRR